LYILVCVKQVPDTAEIKIDPVTHALLREDVPGIVNPFDVYALEMAARIKDRDSAVKIAVLSMGPSQARRALRQCLALGADEAYLASDRAFSGSDTLATSYVLSKAIEWIQKGQGPFDLILCGRQAIDGDTAQAGPELAQRLGYPHITCVKEILFTGGGMQVTRETQSALEIWESSLPAVVTVARPEFEPRCPSIGAKLAANRAAVRVLTMQEIEARPELCGLRGSPTAVKKTFTPQPKAACAVIREENPRLAAAQLAPLLMGLPPGGPP